jgi:ATP-dependent RNA helicase RhlE
MLQRLCAAGRSSQRAPRALVLVPTRELAAQVFSSARSYGRYTPLRGAVIFGGVSFMPQIDSLRRGVDVVVATPGRLLDHVRQRTLDLSQVTMVVLDEADRMLDMGFIHDIKKILSCLPAVRQNLMFSATFSPEIRQLAETFLTDPVAVDVAPRNAAAERVNQVAHPVEGGRKRELLSHLIRTGNWEQVLVFARTKHGANRLAEQLSEDGILADAIHGNKSQAQRTRALQDFKRGRVRVLVATDIAARGLDIEALPHVVNFDLPHVPEDYVHRIGRTGRAGMEGDAVSLVSRDEERMLVAVERLIKRRITRQVVDGFEPQLSGGRGIAGRGASLPTRQTATSRSVGMRPPRAAANPEPVVEMRNVPLHRSSSELDAPRSGRQDSSRGRGAAMGGRRDTERRPQEVTQLSAPPRERLGRRLWTGENTRPEVREGEGRDAAPSTTPQRKRFVGMDSFRTEQP